MPDAPHSNAASLFGRSATIITNVSCCVTTEIIFYDKASKPAKLENEGFSTKISFVHDTSSINHEEHFRISMNDRSLIFYYL